MPRSRASVDQGDAGVERGGESLRDIAQWLTVSEVPFTVLEPPELLDACRAFARRHAELAARYNDA